MTIKNTEHDRQPLDPQVERELRLIDALVAGEAIVPAQDEDLRGVVAELRTAAPRPQTDFTTFLDAAVERGFAAGTEDGNSRGTANAGGGKRRFGRKQWLALGSACAVMLVVVTGTLTMRETGQGLSLDGTTSKMAPPAGEQTESDGIGAAIESAPRQSSEALDESAKALQAQPENRKQVRTARLELAAPFAELEQSADEVVATVDKYGGYVEDSSVTGGDATAAGATFALKIPADKFNAALADLSEIAHVRSRTQNTQDVTNSYNRTRAALSDARARRAGLLKALAKADTEQQVDSIRLRLRGVNQRIERLDEQLGRLDQRIEFVDLEMTILATTADPDGSWGLGDALDDAWSVLRTIAGVLIVGLAILAPFALIAVLAALAWRHRRRRSRERVIDAQPPTDGA